MAITPKPVLRNVSYVWARKRPSFPLVFKRRCRRPGVIIVYLFSCVETARRGESERLREARGNNDISYVCKTIVCDCSVRSGPGGMGRREKPRTSRVRTRRTRAATPHDFNPFFRPLYVMEKNRTETILPVKSRHVRGFRKPLRQTRKKRV